MDAKEKSLLAALLIVDAGVFFVVHFVCFVDAEGNFVLQNSFVNHAEIVRVDAGNKMHNEKNMIVDAKEIMQDANDCGVDAKEFPVDEKNPGVHEKNPGVDENVARVDEKSLVQDDFVFMQDDSSVPDLRETPIVHAFFPGDMDEGKCEDAFSFGVMHKKKSKDAFSFRKVHPPTFLHTFSAFVLKRRTSMHNPAVAVDKNDTVQRTEMTGRQATKHIVQQFAMHPCYERSSHKKRGNRRIFRLSTFFFAPRTAGGPRIGVRASHALNRRRREAFLTPSSSSNFAGLPTCLLFVMLPAWGNSMRRRMVGKCRKTRPPDYIPLSG